MEGNVKKPTENNMFAQYIYGTQNVPKSFLCAVLVLLWSGMQFYDQYGGLRKSDYLTIKSLPGVNLIFRKGCPNHITGHAVCPMSIA